LVLFSNFEAKRKKNRSLCLIVRRGPVDHALFFFFFFYLPQATRHHRLARAQKTFSNIFFTVKLQQNGMENTGE
jgi:hypothetical protein